MYGTLPVYILLLVATKSLTLCFNLFYDLSIYRQVAWPPAALLGFGIFETSKLPLKRQPLRCDHNSHARKYLYFTVKQILNR